VRLTARVMGELDELVNISKKILRAKFFHLAIFPLNVLKKKHYSPISIFSKSVNAKKPFQP
jgi:hypothetical protein